jgi:2-oxoglutarate ferredoxin oxidoreductase subunit alpha
MNPAALKVHLGDVVRGGLLILNEGEFTDPNLAKAGWAKNPLTDGSLAAYRLLQVDFNKLVLLAVEGLGLTTKEAFRCKNFYALGLVFWIYGRDAARQETAIREKFVKDERFAEANVRAFKAGNAYGETVEAFQEPYHIAPAKLAPGRYRDIAGNAATALGLVAAAQRAGLRLFYGTYPITPASEILHELAKLKRFQVTTFQAEDEIAGICSAIGASFGGALGVTGSSGPGIALKTEAIGLAIMAELPLVIVNVQRGGPSTGLPTKTEQSDLFQALFGRNGESPIPVLAARSPADCFEAAMEAARIAIEHRTPVLLLTDGSIANGSEPWKLPAPGSLGPIDPHFCTDPVGFSPANRDPETLGRVWALPGTPGLEHRIGGLEKDFVTGNISYDGHNHEKMIHTRAEKVARVARSYPPTELLGDPDGDVLVLSWGGTFGSVAQGVADARAKGIRCGAAHLRYLRPLPPDLLAIAARYKKVLVPELNLGQLREYVRGALGLEGIGLNKVQGKPFHVAEVREAIERLAAQAQQQAPQQAQEKELRS